MPLSRLTTSLRDRLHSWFHSRGKKRGRRPAAPRIRLGLEALEERNAAGSLASPLFADSVLIDPNLLMPMSATA